MSFRPFWPLRSRWTRLVNAESCLQPLSLSRLLYVTSGHRHSSASLLRSAACQEACMHPATSTASGSAKPATRPSGAAAGRRRQGGIAHPVLRARVSSGNAGTCPEKKQQWTARSQSVPRSLAASCSKTDHCSCTCRSSRRRRLMQRSASSSSMRDAGLQSPPNRNSAVSLPSSSCHCSRQALVRPEALCKSRSCDGGAAPWTAPCQQ